MFHAQQAFGLINTEADCILMLFHPDGGRLIIAVADQVSLNRLYQIHIMAFFILDKGIQRRCVKLL